MTFEVDFADVDFDAHHKAGIRDALRRIQWGHPVNGVRVLRRFNEGVSGACVLQVRLSIGNGSRVKVVKIAPADETNREWHAYQRWIAPFTNAYCTPLPERTPDREPGDPAREWTALVYDHVGQFAGSPMETVRTLEELGGGGLDVMATAVDKVLAGTKDVLHGRWKLVREGSSLRGLNPDLGPSLVLELEGFSGRGAPGAQPPLGRYDLLHHDEVLQRTASGGPRDVEIGTRIAVSDLRVERRGDMLLAVDDEIEVELRAALDARVGLGDLVDGMTIAVWGQVVGTRGRTHRDRVMAALGPAIGEHSTGDPFTILSDVLCDTRDGRVLAVCHGDLNLRNVLCVGDKLYLIDYARAGERAQQTDFCWLEVGVMRDVLAGHGFGSLLRLQRCLALATVLIEIGYDARAVPPLIGPLAGTGMREAFELLFVARRRAWSCYPEEAGPRFAEEYLRHLFLSAHRTMKWPDEWQTTEKVRAGVAMAAVAAEWLDGGNPFRHWSRSELSVALTALAPVIPLHDRSAVRLMVDLVREIEAGGTPDDEVERVIRRLATRVVGCRCRTAAQAFFVTHRRNDDFVDLPTSPSGPGVVRTLLNARSVVLVGPAGSGKSTVARELARRLAADVVAERPARMPVLVADARELSLAGLLSASGLAEIGEESFALGAVHVIIDVPSAEDDPRIPELVRTVQKRFPRTRMVVCRRQVGAVSARVEELQPLDHRDMVAWFRRALGDRTDAEHLVNVLLDDPRWRWVDLGRPAWLSLVAGYVREHGLPAPVPMPHEVIAMMPDRVDVKGDARLHHSYLRARELSEGDADLVVDGVLRTTEWDAYRILATLPGTNPGLVRRLADAVVDRHPVMAAELLCAASLDVSDVAERMVKVLRDPEAGHLRWRAAAHALTVLGRPEGAEGLARAAVSATAPVAGARAALAFLGQLYDTTLPRPHRRDVATVLVGVVRQVLETPELEPLWETALALVEQTGVPGLELHVAALVDEAQRWPVLRGAVRALRAHGTALPPPLVATHRRASHARLAVLEATLPRLTTRAEINEAYKERCRLIAELAPTATLPWLLRRRFAFDAHRRVADVIDKCIGGDPDDPTLIEQDIAQDDEMAFRVMAYRLLRETPETAGAELTRLSPDPSATRLLVAAAAMPYADRSRIGDVAGRFLAMLPTVEADRLEGMAALVMAIHGRDRWLGMRLARLATDALAERDVQARHCWPWAEAITRIHAASRDLDAMLCAGGDVARAAASTLMSHDFHRSGRPGPLHRLSERARRLLRDMPRNVGWALAAAAVNLTEALPEVLELVEESDRVARRGSAHYGVFEQAEAADVLAVVGYLGRMAYEERTMAHEVAAAQRFLFDFEVLGRHPSVAAGRLIGLAYLGEWQSILRADLSDPRLRDAARHAIVRWLPGPATPPGGESPLAVARWITERLCLRSIRTDQRWALDDLRECAERAAGVLVDR